MTWTFDNLDLIRELTLNHVELAILPIVLSFVLAHPARAGSPTATASRAASSSAAAACSSRSRRCRCS